jgi:hypothetical protein
VKQQHKRHWGRRRDLQEEARIIEGLKSKPLAWRRIVPLLRLDHNLGNTEVQDLAGIKPSERLSRSAMNRVRIYCKVRGPQGRRARKL